MNDKQFPVLSAEQIRQWDVYSATRQHISSPGLMERAAGGCLQWLQQHDYIQRSFTIFCAKGNNGGDGLALARMLAALECKVTVYILEFGHKGTEDFQANLMLLHQTPVEILFIQQEESIYPIPENDVIIDALFGSGLNRPLEGVTRKLVEHINQSENEVISIDLPSGMYADSSSKGNTVVKANHTISFEAYKLAFLLPENAEYTGEVYIIDIQLSPDYLNNLQLVYEMINPTLIKSIYKPRKKYSHKGDYGHAVLIAGSYGMMGAAVLSAKACLRAGTGKLTCYVPACGYTIMQQAVPEAMVQTSKDKEHVEPGIEIHSSDTIGIGPGIGTHNTYKQLLLSIFRHTSPIVVDADALNTLSKYPDLLTKLPALSILTPHPKEFDRMFGKAANDFERLEKVRDKAKELEVIIVLKGHYTIIAMPGGKTYFNSTGNAGMATAGSGDVLTGILTALLAQKYTPEKAALLGVYLHGLAGDIAAAVLSEEAMIASDIIHYLPDAFRQLKVVT